MLNINVSTTDDNAKLKDRVVSVLNFAAEKLSLSSGYIEVHLVPNEVMDKNVLSYPAPKDFLRPDIAEKFLGEIYLNPDYIKNHNEDFNLMLVHGFLHLLGYDHKKDEDALKMEAKERELLKEVSEL